MTRRQVKRLLGKPDQAITGKQYMGLYSGVGRLGGGRQRRTEAWLYANTPRAGQLTFIDFERGRVTNVVTQQSTG